MINVSLSPALVKVVKEVKHSNKKRRLLTAALLAAVQLLAGTLTGVAQTGETASNEGPTVAYAPRPPVGRDSSLALYLDQADGMTVDEAVRHALEHNAELKAARAELEAARARVRQAWLRPNPTVEVMRGEQVSGGDNMTNVTGMLPLELGGRRSARVRVAERELEVQEHLLADRERLLAAEVRAKFGEALARMRKLDFTEELLDTTRRGYRLVQARVTEGRTAPLEQNMVLVEVNTVRSMREVSEGEVIVTMLELRNILGMEPTTPLHLRGDFPGLDPLSSLPEATARALAERPDLKALRAALEVAEARIEQARSEGRLDASLVAGYERNKMGFPVRGIDEAGRPAPVMSVFHSVKVGVALTLPVRNKNQGAVEAAVAEAEAAERRLEFGELTIRREVVAAYARYEAAARAREIFRMGVRDQAGENLEVVRKTYELGAKTLIDYIAERRRFIELEDKYVDALLETYLALVAIERESVSPKLITR